MTSVSVRVEQAGAQPAVLGGCVSDACQKKVEHNEPLQPKPAFFFFQLYTCLLFLKHTHTRPQHVTSLAVGVIHAPTLVIPPLPLTVTTAAAATASFLPPPPPTRCCMHAPQSRCRRCANVDDCFVFDYGHAPTPFPRSPPERKKDIASQ